MAQLKECDCQQEQWHLCYALDGQQDYANPNFLNPRGLSSVMTSTRQSTGDLHLASRLTLEPSVLGLYPLHGVPAGSLVFPEPQPCSLSSLLPLVCMAGLVFILQHRASLPACILAESSMSCSELVKIFLKGPRSTCWPLSPRIFVLLMIC